MLFLKSFLDKIRFISGRLFRDRQILVITENHILNLQLRAKYQKLAVFMCTILLFWVTYTSGQYVTLLGIIAKKDQDIVVAENNHYQLQVQYQVLQQELVKFNQYLDKVGLKDAEKSSFQPIELDESKKRKAEELRLETDSIMSSIEAKVKNKINSLESLVEETGLRINAKAKSDIRQEAKVVPSNINYTPVAQGGPFVALEDRTKEQIFELASPALKNDIAYLAKLTEVVRSLPLGFPIDEANITSVFGARSDPFHGSAAWHEGIDLDGVENASIYSTAAGIVTLAGRKGDYGNMIEINHGNGITTRYAHLNQIFVSEGQKVAEGDIIGFQGNTGRSTGSHLHYEVRYNNTPHDPYKFLKAGGHVL